MSLLLAGVLLAAPAAASPRYVHLSWSDPDAAHTMTVTWMTDSVADPSVVHYGIASPDEQEATGTVIQGNGSLGAIHEVLVTGLTPGTKYQYRVGGDGDWSEPFTFTTGPADGCAPYRFAAFGDNRPDTDWLPQTHWNPILEETAQTGPALFLHTGDIVKSGDQTEQWDMFYNSSHPYLAYIPFLTVLGNHDDGPGDGDAANFNQTLSFPRNEVTNTEDYYYVLYGNSIMVGLSSQTCDDGNPPFAVQAQWLDKVLTEHPMKWKLVFLHHPPYTSHLKFEIPFMDPIEFNHPPNENGQNEALVPVFDKHHVDIVFAGHNHYYERFEPLVAGSDWDDGKVAGGFSNGTVYVITGGAGAFVYDEFDILGIQIDLVSWVCGKATGSKVCSGKHHYVVVDIADNKLHYEAWETAEQLLGSDPANKKMLDSFEIVKEETPECVSPPPEPEPDEVEPVPDVVEQGPEAVSPEVVEPQVEPAADLVARQDVGGPDAVPAKDVPRPGDVPAVEVTADAAASEDTGADIGPRAEPRGCGCRMSDRPTMPWGAVLLMVVLGAAVLLVRGRARVVPGLMLAACAALAFSCGNSPGVYHHGSHNTAVLYNTDADVVEEDLPYYGEGDCWDPRWGYWVACSSLDGYDVRGEAPDAECPPGEGCAGQLCKTNSDCFSGFCILTGEGKLCTTECTESCPFGWECRQFFSGRVDVVFVCQPAVSPVLCLPCSSSDQCFATASPEVASECVDLGEKGAFCGLGCKLEGGCLEGYECKHVSVFGAEIPMMSWQCVPKLGYECECTQYAIETAAAGACWTSNEHGSCPGTQHCDAELGLVCEGQMAAAEECNGEDDDCDGETDENLPDLDEDGQSDCVDYDDDGDGDPDLTDCAATDPALSHFAKEACNGHDDDCDGQTDEKGADGCTTWYMDVDQDGYGVETLTACLCQAEDLYTTAESGDCAALDPEVHPGAKEVAGNGKDDNCDGKVE